MPACCSSNGVGGASAAGQQRQQRGRRSSAIIRGGGIWHCRVPGRCQPPCSGRPAGPGGGQGGAEAAAAAGQEPARPGPLQGAPKGGGPMFNCNSSISADWLEGLWQTAPELRHPWPRHRHLCLTAAPCIGECTGRACGCGLEAEAEVGGSDAARSCGLKAPRAAQQRCRAAGAGRGAGAAGR
jgi:hypothetical protein